MKLQSICLYWLNHLVDKINNIMLMDRVGHFVSHITAEKMLKLRTKKLQSVYTVYYICLYNYHRLKLGQSLKQTVSIYLAWYGSTRIMLGFLTYETRLPIYTWSFEPPESLAICRAKAVHILYLHFLVILRPWLLVQFWRLNPWPPILQSSTLLIEVKSCGGCG